MLFTACQAAYSALMRVKNFGVQTVNLDSISSPYYKVVFVVIPVVSWPKSPTVAIK
jgi:hypothetical protein